MRLLGAGAEPVRFEDTEMPEREHSNPAETPASSRKAVPEWRWDAGPSGGRKVRLEAGDGGAFVFTLEPESSTAVLTRLSATGEPAWRRAFSPGSTKAAALLLEGPTLYAALYLDTATGCRLEAFDAASGQPIWSSPLEGLGPLHHSKYANRVQLRWWHGKLAIFGDESGGRYVEVVEPATGARLSHQVFGHFPRPTSKKESR